MNLKLFLLSVFTLLFSACDNALDNSILDSMGGGIA